MLAGKVIGGALVLGASAAIGWYGAERIRQRTKELKELEQALLMLKGDIRFAKTTLPEAIARLSRYHEGSFSEFFRVVSAELLEYSGVSLNEIWRQRAGELLKNTALNAKDKEFVAELGDMLGVSDVQLQQNTLELAAERLSAELTAASGKEKDRMYLCRALGVLGGIFLTVLLL